MAAFSASASSAGRSPCSSRPCEVQVDPAQAQRVGLRPRPVDVTQEVAGLLAGPGPRAEGEQALVVEPGVQVDAAPEAAEAVVAQDDDQRLVVGVLQGPADDRVAPPVVLVDHAGHRGGRGLAPVGRMVGLAEPPEHVLDPVGRVEQAEEEPLVEPLQLVEHHRLALVPDVVALVEERLLVEPLVAQAGVVLDHPGRVDTGRCARASSRA